MLAVILLTAILSILTASAVTTANAVSSTDRPFWTERSSFTHGDTLYAVGVASNAPSSEAGRRAAFAHGLEEIKGYGQVSGSLDGLLKRR